MSAVFDQLQDTIQYRFQDVTLLQVAMTHSSMSMSNEEAVNYERLEFLGDRVLGLVMADILYNRYPDEKEGDLAKRHAALVQGKTLSQIARDIHLEQVMILSESERAAGGAENDNVLADGMEALLGAIYLDSDLSVCKTLISSLWGDLIDVMVEPPQDPKTALQEWAQGRGLPLPDYEMVGREGPDHAPLFTICVTVEGHEAEEAKGASRRAAEKKAAEKLLRRLEGGK